MTLSKNTSNASALNKKFKLKKHFIVRSSIEILENNEHEEIQENND